MFELKHATASVIADRQLPVTGRTSMGTDQVKGSLWPFGSAPRKKSTSTLCRT